MILEALLGLSLVVSVSVDDQIRLAPNGVRSPAQMSLHEKEAAVRPLVRSATECVARTISTDPRFAAQIAKLEINDLIVDSMGSCADVMRTMIDGYDRMFGMGSGEVFFSGPYLDVLPAAVHRLLKEDAGISHP